MTKSAALVGKKRSNQMDSYVTFNRSVVVFDTENMTEEKIIDAAIEVWNDQMELDDIKMHKHHVIEVGSSNIEEQQTTFQNELAELIKKHTTSFTETNTGHIFRLKTGEVIQLDMINDSNDIDDFISEEEEYKL